MFTCKPIFKIFAAHFRTKRMLNHDNICMRVIHSAVIRKKPASERPRIVSRLEYAMVYFTLKWLHFSNQEKFGSAPPLYVNVKTFGGNWLEHDIKRHENDVKTSKRHQNLSYWRHARVILHPSCKTTFSSPGWVHRNSGRLCKNYPFITYHLIATLSVSLLQHYLLWKLKYYIHFRLPRSWIS